MCGMYNILLLPWNGIRHRLRLEYALEISKCRERSRRRPRNETSTHKRLHGDLLTAARTRAGSHSGDRFPDRREGSGARAAGGRGDPHWGAGLVPGKLLLVFT